MISERFIEAFDKDNKVYSLRCDSDEVENVKAAFKCSSGINLKQTKKTKCVPHGGYARCSRFDIEQHAYAGGGHPGCGGYTELLEVKDALEGKCKIVIYWHYADYNSSVAGFTEWYSLDNAKKAFENHFPLSGSRDEIEKKKGFLRIVDCNHLTPWFFAVGDQHIIGDYVFPEYLQDDPVYKIGEKFIVTEDDEKTFVKTCLGSILNHSSERIVIWDDGSTWSKSGKRSSFPILLKDKDKYITIAPDLARQLSEEKRTINLYLGNGTVFKGKIEKQKDKNLEGEYYLKVFFNDGFSRSEEVFLDFKPTKRYPTILSCLKKKFPQREIRCFECETQ